jgi:hypothetical protein
MMTEDPTPKKPGNIAKPDSRPPPTQGGITPTTNVGAKRVQIKPTPAAHEPPKPEDKP